MATEADFLLAIAENPDDGTARFVFADWLEDHNQLERAAMVRTGVIKRFGVDFTSASGSLTLSSSEVHHDGDHDGHFTRTHSDGWTIGGLVKCDYVCWVEDFVATHPTLGRVEGNFESLVFATSETAFKDFYEKHTPDAYDLADV